MIIAAAYDQDGNVGEHFGHAEMFAIYDYESAGPDQCSKTLVDASDRHGHQAMADLMKEKNVDAVITQRMGGEAKAALLSYGIVPVTGFAGSADILADLLVMGQLPIIEGGNCSGCGGDCSHDEDGNCGCGCDGHCGASW